jgi:hypothetical protein
LEFLKQAYQSRRLLRTQYTFDQQHVV